MSQLSVIFPEPVELPLGRHAIQIRPVEFRHFAMFGRAAGQLLAVAANASYEQALAYAERNATDLRRLLRATTSLSRWRLSRLPAAVLLQVALQVVRVNGDFFAQALGKAAEVLNGQASPSA
ncbi:hypothetical protein D9M68_448280 [compost metagenome]